MQDALQQLAKLAELQKETTAGPWLLTTINTNPRGLRNYKQVVRATDAGILGGLPVPKITMQLTFDGYGEMGMQSDGTPDGYWPTTETRRNATFIATAGSTDFAALLATLSAPAPLATGGAGEAGPFFWADCTLEEYAAILAAFRPLKQAHKWPMEQAYAAILTRFKQAAAATVRLATGEGGEALRKALGSESWQAGMLADIEKMNAATERATDALHDLRLNPAERLDLARGFDQAAGNRYAVLADAYTKLRTAAVAALSPAPGVAVAAGGGWIYTGSDAETNLPKHDGLVFIRTDRGYYDQAMLSQGGGWQGYGDDCWDFAEVTHWMEIPKLPAASEKGGPGAA